MDSRTILVAEDEADDVVLLRRAFETSGSLVALHFVGNGEEALAYLHAQHPYNNRKLFPFPDLLLLDLNMPGIDGFGVLESMRAHPFFKRLPVVVLSSSNRPRDIALALEMGANSVLVKPSKQRDLIALVRSIENYWLNLNRAAHIQKAQTSLLRRPMSSGSTVVRRRRI